MSAVVSKAHAPKPSPGAPAAPGIESAPAVLLEVERLVDARFGPGRSGLGPLLKTLRKGLAALAPGPGEPRLSPEEQDKARAAFAGTADTLEDVLEALHRAGRARGVTGWGER